MGGDGEESEEGVKESRGRAEKGKEEKSWIVK